MFTQLLLADEVNRASPKTQSALLEAMEERQVSVDVTTYRLPDPFFVVATQNPFEQLGTFRLPESQLDRFLMRISLGYPDAAHERTLLAEGDRRDLLAGMPPALNPDGVRELQAAAQRVHVCACAARLRADADREHAPAHRRPARPVARAPARAWCAPRAPGPCSRAATCVIPEDVQAVFAPVAAHRLERAASPPRRITRRSSPSSAAACRFRCTIARCSRSCTRRHPQGNTAPPHRRLGPTPPGRGPAARHHRHAARVHPADARRPRLRGAGVRHAAGGPQLLEQHRAVAHVPAGGLRPDRDASHASQSGRRDRCVPSPASTPSSANTGTCCSRWKMPPTPPASASTARSRGARALPWTFLRAVAPRRCVAVTAAARPPDGRSHQAVHRLSVRTVSRLDLRPPARLVARLARAARPTRSATRDRERRQRHRGASRRR